MAQKRWLPQAELDIAELLTKFGIKIAVHGATVGLTPAEITELQALCACGAASIGLQNDVTKYAQGVTRFKNAVLLATEPVTAYPADFTKAAGLPAISKAGVIPLLCMQVRRIKAHVGYTTEIGKELGIEGAETPMPSSADLSAMKPVLVLTLASGGHPNVGWKKKGMQGIKLQVDRGDGHGMVFLATDTEPDYLDTTPLPASGVTAVWKYRATYIQHDVEVGQWCDPVSITVTGV